MGLSCPPGLKHRPTQDLVIKTPNMRADSKQNPGLVFQLSEKAHACLTVLLYTSAISEFNKL